MDASWAEFQKILENLSPCILTACMHRNGAEDAPGYQQCSVDCDTVRCHPTDQAKVE
jgi:hypothetical protein